jgi:hypothetical protein
LNLNGGTPGICVASLGGPNPIITKVVLAGDPTPIGGISPTNSMNYYYINGPGQVAFLSSTTAGKTGIFIGSAGTTPVKVVATGDPAPGGGTFSSFVAQSPAGFNDRGEVVFFAMVNGGKSGLFVGKADGTVQAVVQNDMVVPGAGVYAFKSSSKDARTNPRGDILFQAPLTGSCDSGLFLRRYDTGIIETIALQGQPAPGSSWSFTTLNTTLNNFPGEMMALNTSGEVLFGTTLMDNSGSYHSGTFFRYMGPGTLEKIITRGDMVAGSGGGIAAYVSQSPGAGDSGMFFVRVRVLNGAFADGIYAVVVDTAPPVIQPHNDLMAEATGPGGAFVVYTNPTWTDDLAGTGLAICVPTSGSLFPLGNTRVTCTATDGRNQAVPVTFAVHVVDTTPPTLSATSDTSVLWPLTGKLKSVTITGLAADEGSGVAETVGSFEVIDEYGLVQPRGTFKVSSAGTFTFTVELEVSRLGTDKDGRRYTIGVTVRDRAGNAASTSVIVMVPHDQGK